MTKLRLNKHPLAHIQFSQINKRYRRKGLGRLLPSKSKQDRIILDNAELTLKGGECYLLTGSNGSGKSTLLRILAGLLKPDSANINTGLESMSWKQARKLLRQQMMYLYQEPYMFDGNVTRNLEYAVNGEKSAYQIKQALKWANLEHCATTSAKCLSGGERQRVALAQAWLKQPCLLLLDEPTANMDEASRIATEGLLNTFKEMGTALLIASHDLNHFHKTMDKRLLLEDGIITEVDHTAADYTYIDTAHDNVAPFPKKTLSQKP